MDNENDSKIGRCSVCDFGDIKVTLHKHIWRCEICVNAYRPWINDYAMFQAMTWMTNRIIKEIRENK